MSTDVLKRLGLFAGFILAQVVVLGRIHLLGIATPLFYVYFVSLFPRNYPKWGVLLWSFFLGLFIDIFTNTPGLASTALTLLAFVQPPFFELFVPRDSVDDLKPSLHSIGVLKYSYYITFLVFIYCVVFFSLEMFSFSNWLHWLMCVVGSTLITLALIFTFEIARNQH